MDTANSERKMWLVKMPLVVAKRWREACAQGMEGEDDIGPELGRVRLQPGSSEAHDFKMTLTGPMMASVPIKEYDMRRHTADILPMRVFSQDKVSAAEGAAGGSGGGRIALRGKVDQKFDLDVNRGVGTASMRLDDTYRKLNRDRHVASSTKTRTLQLIDDPRGAVRAPLPQQGMLKRKAPKGEEPQKRVRMGRDELERLLFRLFDRRPHWSFGQLQRETDQPAAWLKEVLADVAVLNKKGPYKDQWEVKREYKGQGGNNQGKGGLGGGEAGTQ